MKATLKLTGKALLASLLLAGGLTNIANAASGDDETYKNMTLEERLYLFDGYGSKWGMDAGNDGLWFVADRPVPDTYGAALKIRNVAKNNTLVIGGIDDQNATSGYVGIGTDTPESQLNVKWEGSNPEGDGLTKLMVLETTNSDASKTSDAGFVLRNGRTGKQWNFRTTKDGSGFAATIDGTKGTEFEVVNDTNDKTNTKLYLGNGASCVNGVWTNKSSRASKENIQPLSSKEAMDAFNKLQPMTYNYKSDKSEQYVGFIAEDVPKLVAINSRDGLSAMDMVAVLTKVVQEQNKQLKLQEEKIKELGVMQKRLAKVESLLTNLALDTSKTINEKVSFNTK